MTIWWSKSVEGLLLTGPNPSSFYYNIEIINFMFWTQEDSKYGLTDHLADVVAGH